MIVINRSVVARPPTRISGARIWVDVRTTIEPAKWLLDFFDASAEIRACQICGVAVWAVVGQYEISQGGRREDECAGER